MPLERDRYPENWEAISNQVRELAGWRCETCGKCCMQPGEDWLAFILRTGWTVGEAIAQAAKPRRFWLTTAHLDQDPSNNAPGNLKALCLPCHKWSKFSICKGAILTRLPQLIATPFNSQSNLRNVGCSTSEGYKSYLVRVAHWFGSYAQAKLNVNLRNVGNK